MSIVSTDWLAKNLNRVKVIDCSWHMPQTKREGYKEYQKEHIGSAIFFDLSKNSKKNTDLPHMLTNLNSWERIVSELGIKNEDEIVIYDNSDVISSCRCWYNFIYFGHNPKLVHVLDGGLQKWNNERKNINNEIIKINKTNYKAKELNYLVKNKKQIDENINLKKFKILDARSKNRFFGLEKEFRAGLKSGSIKNSYNLPFDELIDKKTKTFLNKSNIKERFDKIGINNENNIVFSCGSGVTASVLGLAYSLINDKYLPIIYDGSWSEYGKIK